MALGHVFLSHNHGDKGFVRRLATDLRDRGVTVWLDEWQLSVGDSIADRIQSGILEAGYLAVVLSPRSVGSDWVRREVNAALAEEIRRRGVFILPILAEDCDLPLFLRDKMYADFRHKYDEGLHAVLKVVMPGEVTPPKLMFDCSRDDPSYQSWAVHCSLGVPMANVQLIGTESGSNNIRLVGRKGHSIGLNKSVPTLHGRAWFEYRVISVGVPQEHVYFAMIPIQETGYNRAGVVEVGTNVAGDPRNPQSPHRIRYYVPTAHQIDHEWHTASIDFDFRDTPTAFYSIFAARVNEGVAAQGDAELELGNTRIYSW